MNRSLGHDDGPRADISRAVHEGRVCYLSTAQKGHIVYDDSIAHAVETTCLTAEDVVLQATATRNRAERLLRSGNTDAAELYQAGYRAGIEEGERRAAARAEAWAATFLYELGDLPEVPALDPVRERRAAA